MAVQEELVNSQVGGARWSHCKQGKDSGFLSTPSGSTHSFELMDANQSAERVDTCGPTPLTSMDLLHTPFSYTHPNTHSTKKLRLSTSLKRNYNRSLCDSGYETSHQVSSNYSPMSFDQTHDSLLASTHCIGYMEEASLYSESVNHPICNGEHGINMMNIEEGMEVSFKNDILFCTANESCEESGERFVTPDSEERMDFSEYCTSDDVFMTPFNDGQGNQVPQETMVVSVPTISPPKSPPKRKFLSATMQRRRFPVGTEQLDILFFLGEKQNYTPVVSQILSLLSARDLCSATIVSKAWQRIVNNDLKAYKRWRRYINKLKSNCENLPIDRKGSEKMKGAFLRRTELSEIGNRNLSTPEGGQLTSPPCSPSKLKFNLFQKEVHKLGSGEELLQCPRCLLPARLVRTLRLAQCLRLGCQFRFCALCRCVYHEEPRCELTSSTPRARKRISSIGSKESKKNLRRL